MFNSFLDGTKSAIEMAAVANATGLHARPLEFPPAGADDLPDVLQPRDAPYARGGLEPAARRHAGPDDLRWGVFVVFAAADDYVAARSPTTACAPMRAAGSPRCTGPRT